MEMKGISEYLQKYRLKLYGAEDKRKEVIEVISRVCGFIISGDMITINKGVVTVKGNTMIKNELFMRKQQILTEIRMIGRKDIYDII